ncbi:hypothetical protein FXV77_00325 [Sphingobacterium phlebotomi]|uniref:Uncharacterized protein n=1 Tax=Sphingobacterium phlebotomi TaxID=2605433 RepID=A0A5D4HB38_9SPHI|nr:hypothetical protein [Sphingobacterium phlebotomi]TYR37774.1 hypothetical protein FXV77_00325 [Sphingobacterium phlebotomi]
MDGLDLLKQHWNNDNNFPRVNEEEIKYMLYQRSSSIIKWVFIISIMELSVGIVLGFILPIDQKITSSFESFLGLTFGIAFRAVILYFIYNFFKNYRKIKNTTDTKTLLITILTTQQYVDHYIKFNVYFFIFIMTWRGLQHIVITFVEKSIGEGILMSFLVVIVIAPIVFITIYLMKLYYRILYRRLINKLDDNYEELIRIDKG